MRHDDDLQDSDPQEREISLGTATILGIFLALALVCAAFFGFGYSMGRHSSPPTAAAAPPASTKTDSPFSQFKTQPDASDDASSEASPNGASTGESPAPVAAPQPAAKTPAATRNVTFPVPAQPVAPAAAKPSLASANGPQFIVQVSATSRRGDAEALIAALHQKGYVAAIHQEPQDQLFHVQFGPFATKADATVMRKRLDTDGYKAIVK